MDQNYIEIKGAKTNNLKDLDLKIPKRQMVVFVGLSGSGKSSVIMDTLYAEGQRRYVESLSSYARQFLGRMKKPEVEYIKGICPAIAIEQHKASGSSRSTVGSLTEISDYLRLFFARAGRTYSPVSGNVVRQHKVTDLVELFDSIKEGEKVFILAPVQDRYPDRLALKEMEMLEQKGYSRYILNGETSYIEEWLAKNTKAKFKVGKLREKKFRILLDRMVKKEDADLRKRFADSVGLAFSEFYGECIILVNDKEHYFSHRFELDGIEFEKPSVYLFNSNNPLGACKTCEGFGQIQGISKDKVVPNQSLSIYEGAISCWAGEKGLKWLDNFIEKSAKYDFPIHKPYYELNTEEKTLIWEGSKGIKGINAYFDTLKAKLYKIQNRVILSRFRGRTACPDCRGSRLKKEASYVKVGGYSFVDLYGRSIEELYTVFNNIELDQYQKEISSRLLQEIQLRLKTVMDLGLSYLQLERRAATLSGGETQRIQLARMLGSTLTDSMYILDEPSIGLHPRDTERLTTVLKNLRDLGNTLIVVEHEEKVIENADFVVEIGPGAGIHGGSLVFEGPYKNFIKKSQKSLTAEYMRGDKSLPIPLNLRKPVQFIKISNASLHNLKSVDVQIPLQCLCVVTGVSGSGKSTLVSDILVKGVQNTLDGTMLQNLSAKISGDINEIDAIEYVSQNPLGRSSRSNPTTYVNAYDDIRKLMSQQPAAKMNGLTSREFSFNVPGGRCEKCQGEGEIVIDMQFLAEVRLSCEECKGKRFQKRVLDVMYNGKNIDDILKMSVEESVDFFKDEPKISRRLQCLLDVGLDYVSLGQSSNTLSGGEAQRVKLASFLANHKRKSKNLFVFDEPTTGLHFEDVKKLLNSFNALAEQGHSILVVEHNLDVIKAADWLIDLGPEGGNAGGQVVYEGPPIGLTKIKSSYTGKYLKAHLK